MVWQGVAWQHRKEACKKVYKRKKKKKEGRQAGGTGMACMESPPCLPEGKKNPVPGKVQWRRSAGGRGEASCLPASHAMGRDGAQPVRPSVRPCLRLIAAWQRACHCKTGRQGRAQSPNSHRDRDSEVPEIFERAG